MTSCTCGRKLERAPDGLAFPCVCGDESSFTTSKKRRKVTGLKNVRKVKDKAPQRMVTSLAVGRAAIAELNRGIYAVVVAREETQAFTITTPLRATELLGAEGLEEVELETIYEALDKAVANQELARAEGGGYYFIDDEQAARLEKRASTIPPKLTARARGLR